jgi:hypothetical protein
MALVIMRLEAGWFQAAEHSVWQWPGNPEPGGSQLLHKGILMRRLDFVEKNKRLFAAIVVSWTAALRRAEQETSP